MELLRRSYDTIQQEGLAGFCLSTYSYLRREFGSGRECPLCGGQGSHFLLAGVESRPDAKCPRCGSKERHRLMWLYMKNELDIGESHRLLYFAPIDGVENKIRRDITPNLITTDLLMDSVNILCDITSLPFPDEAFDGIICSHVLEHVPEDSIALSEISRVLEPNGWALILVPQDRDRLTTYENPSVTSEQERREEFGQKDHVRWYGDDVQKRLEGAGFSVKTVDYSTSFSESEKQLYGIIEDEEWIHDPSIIFHCEKN